MEERRKGNIVVPTIYILAITAIFLSIILIMETVQSTFMAEDGVSYVSGVLIDDTVPVMNEELSSEVVQPFSSEKVTVNKVYYDKNNSEQDQQKALLLYQNTYLPNTGIFYLSAEPFEVNAVLEGKVANIKEDELLGKVIEIKHNEKLTTIYKSLNDISVSVGDTVKQGDVIGVSGSNNLFPKDENQLFFEVYLNGTHINPEKLFSTSIEDLLK